MLQFHFSSIIHFSSLVKSTLSVPLKFKWFEKVSDSLWHHFGQRHLTRTWIVTAFIEKKSCKSQKKNELPSLPGHLPALEEVRKEFQGKLFFKPSTANTSRRQYFISRYKGHIGLPSYVINMTLPLSKSTCQQHQAIKLLSPAPLHSLPVMPRRPSLLPSCCEAARASLKPGTGAGTCTWPCGLRPMGPGRPSCWPKRNPWDAEAASPDNSLHPCASVLALW